ncbi:MAG: tetratricopeptide repeat protein [Acidobacteriaceae bacterium]
MAVHAQLDSLGRPANWALILLSIFLLSGHALSQAGVSTAKRVQQVKRLYDGSRWDEVVRMVPESSTESSELELYRGLALAHLGRYPEADRAFQAGHKGHPRDARFLTEMAGVAYIEKRFSTAKIDLRRALGLDPRDAYSNNFLASIYYLEGNLDAALKYWNRVGKPKLVDLIYDPIPKLDPLILDRAFRFSPGSIWTRNRFLTTRAEIQSLDLFPHAFYELQARPDGSFKLVWHDSERNRWNKMDLASIASTLRGLPYQTVYPEFYNLNGSGLNWRSLVRWDDEKRWFSGEIAEPIAQNPSQRFRLYFQDRNENWNVTGRLLPYLSSLSYFNLRRIAIGAGVQSIPNWRWQWNIDTEYSWRNFRTLTGIPQQAMPFFTNSSGLALRSTIQRSLIQFPERRFSLDADITGEAGKFFTSPLGKYRRLEGSVNADWLPQARGEDYETKTRLRAGGTFGQVPLDDLYMLGFDRDNDLWMRGHNDLRNGQKGNSPLGRDFILSNSDFGKVVFHDGLFLVKAGPFLDTGDIYDPSQFFGSPKWLTDTGLQVTVKVLGNFEFVLGYGKDLRSGNNTFYSTVSQ